MNTNGREEIEDSVQLRLFVAIELPADVRELLEALTLQLKRRMVVALGAWSAEQSLKWVAPESLHVTLKFLGYVAPARLEAIQTSLREVGARSPRFTLHTSGVGAFPTMNRPRAVWVGVKGDQPRLTTLQSRVDAAMSDLGFVAEKRPFSPHLTLARVRETTSIGETRLIGQVLKEFAGDPVESRPIAVDSLSLMRSQLSRQGARYTRLAHFELLSAT